MKNLLVRIDRDEASVTFHLIPFLTEWDETRQTFVSCIAREFDDLLRVRPHDFSTASPADLGEAWCKYRIFAGSSTIVLRPDSLRFAFPTLLDTDYPIVTEMIRRGMEFLLPALGGYKRHSYSLASNRHVAVMDGAADTHLARFASDEIADAVRTEPAMEYRPSVGFTLRTDDGNRVLRRSVEQSEVLPNGLFVTTHIFVSVPVLTRFEDEIRWIKQVSEIANHAAGITYQTDEVDDAPGS